MDLKVVTIGNSRGVILPKHLIEEYGITDHLELELEKDHLVLRPPKNPREGWALAIQAEESRAEGLLLPDQPTSWDEEEWTW